MKETPATGTMTCERHGEVTKLTCVDCGQPICPRCLVRTEVGLKCASCARPRAGAAGRRSRRPLLLVLAGIALLATVAVLVQRDSSGSGSAPAPALRPVGSWTGTPDPAGIRGTPSAVLLPDGQVLVTGGGVGAIALSASEVYDPGASRWRPAGALLTARRGHQAVVLADGRVLMTGGVAGGELLASVEIYDPVGGTWSAGAPMSTPRLGHTLTLLPGGGVLAAGGTTPGGAPGAGGGQTIRPAASAEIYDPAGDRWTSVGPMSSARFEHTATALADGRVLLAGGLGPSGDGIAPLVTSELFDPAVAAFTNSANLGEARANHAAALLPDGSVLVAGGAGGSNGDVSLGSAEVFEPRRGAWARVGRLDQARTGATASPTPGGDVLVAGGESAERGTRRALRSAELYEPERRRWRPAGQMACPRSEQSAVVLPDGSILVVAGDAAFPGEPPLAQSCSERWRR